MPILIVGGTRGTGLLIARRLSSQRPVRVLARDPARARERLGPEIGILPGDLTHPETLPAAVRQAEHVVFTAGCRSGYPAREARIRATEYQGVLHTLNALKDGGFSGRFLYMNASGGTVPSFASWALNLYKGNTLQWRNRAEEAIRSSGIDYTIIRAGFLLNSRGGARAIRITQEALPLTLRYRIARADVAEVFLAALDHPNTSRTTFETVWGNGPRQQRWEDQLHLLRPE